MHERRRLEHGSNADNMTGKATACLCSGLSATEAAFPSHPSMSYIVGCCRLGGRRRSEPKTLWRRQSYYVLGARAKKNPMKRRLVHIPNARYFARCVNALSVAIASNKSDVISPCGSVRYRRYTVCILQLAEPYVCSIPNGLKHHFLYTQLCTNNTDCCKCRAVVRGWSYGFKSAPPEIMTKIGPVLSQSFHCNPPKTKMHHFEAKFL